MPSDDRTAGGEALPADAPDPRWWIRDPARLARELRELEALGITHTQDAVAAAHGVCRLELRHPPIPRVSDEVIRLVAVYPDNYPYFPVHVEAPTLSLPHHQNPFGKNLCLLGRGTGRWRPASDTLAGVLATQLMPVLVAGASEDIAAVQGMEEHVPEPISTYYAYAASSVVLVANATDARVPAAARQGTLVLGLESASPTSLPQILRGALLEIRDAAGTVVHHAEASIRQRFASNRIIEARWVRVEAAVLAADPERVAAEVYATAERLDPVRPTAYATDQPGVRLRVRAVLFPEEHAWRGSESPLGDAWAIAVRIAHADVPARGERRPRRMQPIMYLARTSAYAERDLQVRAPALAPLRARTVAVFGLGCLGAPSALEFARASVGSLRLLDHDYVDASTTLRWPFGITAAGAYKVDVLRDVIGRDYPYTRVEAAERYRLGEVRRTGGVDPDADGPQGWEVMHRMLNGADLVYDACAEPLIQHFLADSARRVGTAYVGVHGTPGGWGGVVIAIDPARTTGCWVCAQHWLATPVSEGGFVSPAGDLDEREVQAAGCADRTYVGANPDLGEVALMGVRMAFGILAPPSAPGDAAHNVPHDVPHDVPQARTTPRAQCGWDVAILSLRDGTGTMIPPRWDTYALTRHPSCAACGSLASAPAVSVDSAHA